MASARQFRIDGIVPIIPTPFFANEEIDFEGFEDLLEFAVAGGSCGICLPAYASEFYKLREREKEELVAAAIRIVAGRVAVIGQANHPFAQEAARIARTHQDAGADAVSVAVPRLFSVAERDLLRYFSTVLNAIEIPLIIQDFNPGGATISAQFVADLHHRFPHFRYVKLEEPMMTGKVRTIIDVTSGEVGVLDGWGGVYILELMEAGAHGVMPGLGVADLLARVFSMMRAGLKKDALRVFQGLLPQIVYSLQNMEFFHHVEKKLLEARGVLRHTTVRELTSTIDPAEVAHIDFLNGSLLDLLDSLGMPHNPAAAARLSG
jgi:4-hydroxy-tetrahydrodipicolinate synthase